MLVARIDGVVFEGWPTNYDQCYLISPDGWSGWDDGVDVRRADTARPVSHGSFDAPGYRAARLVTIAGQILADSPTGLANMISRLTGILGDGGQGRLVVEDASRVTWADVRLAAAPKATITGAREADFQVVFWSPSPEKYGETREFAGPTAQVFHRGNFPASPVIEVTGSLPSGYQVASQGKQWVVTQPLTSGQTHRLDIASGWLYRNGSLQVGAVAAAEKFTIPPGKVTPVVFTPASGSGVMTVKVPDTYV